MTWKVRASCTKVEGGGNTPEGEKELHPQPDNRSEFRKKARAAEAIVESRGKIQGLEGGEYGVWGKMPRRWESGEDNKICPLGTRGRREHASIGGQTKGHFGNCGTKSRWVHRNRGARDVGERPSLKKKRCTHYGRPLRGKVPQEIPTEEDEGVRGTGRLSWKKGNVKPNISFGTQTLRSRRPDTRGISPRESELS